MKRLTAAGAAVAFVLAAHWAQAADSGKALERINRRLDNIERRIEGNSRALELDKARHRKRLEAIERNLADSARNTDGLGHKRHPVHSVYGLKVSGGVTFGAQGVSKIKNDMDQRGQASVSADLVFESPVGDNGAATLVLDMVRGAGISNMPTLFTSPNGNTAGPNADIEGFDSDTVHITQAYYEHSFGNGVVVTAGQLDITGYMDANEYANNETSQFMANAFVNNPAVEFGGTDNFYSPGVRLSFGFNEDIIMTVGAFEGDGDYVDTFDNPFLMAEVDVAAEIGRRPGNYRLFVWNRNGRPASLAGNLADPNDAALVEASNNGLGISIDQELTDTLGVWLRYGTQREQVARFDRFYAAGVNLSGAVFGRQGDVVGLGYAASTFGSTYKETATTADPNLRPGVEQYMEVYYNIAVGDAEQETGFHITPDFQYVIHPGGDKEATEYAVYGLRLQAYF